MSNLFPQVLYFARRAGGTRCPLARRREAKAAQRVGKIAAALPPDICAFGDYFAIVSTLAEPREMKSCRGSCQLPLQTKHKSPFPILRYKSTDEAAVLDGALASV
jgi:hypothetical protein